MSVGLGGSQVAEPYLIDGVLFAHWIKLERDLGLVFHLERGVVSVLKVIDLESDVGLVLKVT